MAKIASAKFIQDVIHRATRGDEPWVWLTNSQVQTLKSAGFTCFKRNTTAFEKPVTPYNPGKKNEKWLYIVRKN